MKAIVHYGCGLALLSVSAPVIAEPAGRGQAIVSAFRQATGGSAWDRLEDCYEEGTHADGAIAYRTWFSMRRYGHRVESRRGDGPSRAMGFNGEANWQRDASGAVALRRDEEAVAEGVTTAYLSSNGFFYPDRFPATFRYLRDAVHGGHTFDVVEIVPRGGHALEYWFDRDTHLLTRVVDRRRANAPLTVQAADYRWVGGISVPFSLNMSGPDGRIANRGVVRSLVCRPSDAALYDPPAAP